MSTKSKLANLVEVEPHREGTKDKPTVGPVYRCSYSAEGPPELDGIHTLLDLFEQSAKNFANRPCLGFRRMDNGTALPFEFITYREAFDTVAYVASAYEQLGVLPKDKIGVFGANSPEWMMAMQSMNRLNVACVPLYETLGDNAIEFIMKHSEAKVVVAQGSKLPALHKALTKLKEAPLSAVIYWGDAPANELKGIKDLGFKVLSWSEAVEMGRGKPSTPSRPQPEDMCTIMYTSGTTGDPKGVQISHRAVVASIAGVRKFLMQFEEKFGPDDSVLSYLPLAHIFDRVVEEFMLHHGASIGYWQGDIKKITEDIEALKPTLFVGVPRVFERIYNGVQDQVRKAGLVRRLVFNWAYGRKLYYMKHGWRHDRASMISDALVFGKIKNRLGGRVRVVLTGGAPITPQVEEFLKVSICAPVVQGYGLTETCAASFIAYPYAMDQLGTVGPPLPHTELRLEEVKEMSYSPLDDPPRGEVCIRGPGVFTSYYKAEDLTKDAIDADGFFHTGDIGEILPNGALKIIDRKKNIFKLSQGEYIAVEKVENAYKTCSLVEQIWVYGDSHQSVLVAVVHPRENEIKKWASSNSIDGSFEELCKNPKVIDFVLAEVHAAGKAARLKGLEDIKALVLEPEAFSIENDLITPTFKLKRAQLKKKYQKDIDNMYADLKNKGQAK